MRSIIDMKKPILNTYALMGIRENVSDVWKRNIDWRVSRGSEMNCKIRYVLCLMRRKACKK